MHLVGFYYKNIYIYKYPRSMQIWTYKEDGINKYYLQSTQLYKATISPLT